MSSLLLPGDAEFERTLGRSPVFDISRYSRRQRIALERPEETERDVNFASNEPFKREVAVLNDIQLVSILTIDMDGGWPDWHARVGWMESKGYFVPLRAWQPWMEEPAQRVMSELISLPREVERIRTTVRTHGRPSTIHKFIRLSPEEREFVRGITGGLVKPSLRFRDPRRF
jgi:hypothetical protein